MAGVTSKSIVVVLLNKSSRQFNSIVNYVISVNLGPRCARDNKVLSESEVQSIHGPGTVPRGIM